MLAPRATAIRQRVSLNGLWRFALDRDGAGRTAQWWRALPGTAVEMGYLYELTAELWDD